MKKLLSVFLSVLMCISACSFLLAPAALESSAEPLPASFTLEGTKHLPPVANQGQVGCCASMSITYLQYTNAYSHYIHNLNPASDFDPSSGLAKYNFAPKFTYNLGGAHTGSVYQTIMEQGVPLQTYSSFSGGVTGFANEDTNAKTFSTSPDAWASAQEYRIRHYDQIWLKDHNNFNMTTSPEGRALIDRIKSSLNAGNVVVTGGYPARWKDQFTISGLGTLGKKGDHAIPYSVGNAAGGHQVAFVGYDDEITCTVNGVTLTGAFQLRNSWGTGWNNNGDVWVMYDALNEQSAIDALNVQDRTWTVDQLVFTDWAKDLVIGMPELRVKLDLSVNNRDLFQVKLTRTEKATGTTESVLPYIFKNPGYRPYSDLNFNGTTGKASGEMVFNYDRLLSSIPQGKSVNDYVFGVQIDTKNGADLTVSSIEFLNSAGASLGKNTCNKQMTGADSAFLTTATSGILLMNAPEGASIQFVKGSATVQKGETVQFKVVPQAGYRLAGNMKVSIDGVRISPVDGVYAYKVTENTVKEVRIQGVVPNLTQVGMTRFGDGFENYGGDFIYVLVVSNQNVSKNLYTGVGGANYPYTFRFTVEGTSYEFVPQSMYAFPDSTLYRFNVADGGWFPKNGKSYSIDVEICLNDVPVYYYTVTGDCKIDSHSSVQQEHVHTFNNRTNYKVIENGTCHTNGKGIIYCDHPGCKGHIIDKTPNDPDFHVLKQENIVVKTKATHNQAGELVAVCPHCGLEQHYDSFMAKKGDASGDNQLNIEDVTLLLNFLAKKAPDETLACSPDMNADSIVSIKDLTYLLMMLDGRIPF